MIADRRKEEEYRTSINRVISGNYKKRFEKKNSMRSGS